jgi:hypothetical protein
MQLQGRNAVSRGMNSRRLANFAGKGRMTLLVIDGEIEWTLAETTGSAVSHHGP